MQSPPSDMHAPTGSQRRGCATAMLIVYAALTVLVGLALVFLNWEGQRTAALGTVFFVYGIVLLATAGLSFGRGGTFALAVAGTLIGIETAILISQQGVVLFGLPPVMSITLYGLRLLLSVLLLASASSKESRPAGT